MVWIWRCCHAQCLSGSQTAPRSYAPLPLYQYGWVSIPRVWALRHLGISFLCLRPIAGDTLRLPVCLWSCTVPPLPSVFHPSTYSVSTGVRSFTMQRHRAGPPLSSPDRSYVGIVGLWGPSTCIFLPFVPPNAVTTLSSSFFSLLLKTSIYQLPLAHTPPWAFQITPDANGAPSILLPHVQCCHWLPTAQHPSQPVSSALEEAAQTPSGKVCSHGMRRFVPPELGVAHTKATHSTLLRMADHAHTLCGG